MIESQETFDSAFSINKMDATEIARCIDDEFGKLRAAAGDYVRSLFMRHGYFNGRIDNSVRLDDGTIYCASVVACHGLPMVVDSDQVKLLGVIQQERDLSHQRWRELQDLKGDLREVAAWALAEPDSLHLSPHSRIHMILCRHDK